MSSALYWEPVKEPKNYFTDEIKFALRKKLDEGYICNYTINNSMIPYLEGLRDAGVKGASAVIKALEKHGKIKLKEIS